MADSRSLAMAGQISISTTSDNVTTSYDSFSLADTHSVTGSWYEGETSPSGTIGIDDSGADDDVMWAQGNENVHGMNYTFGDSESLDDNFELNKNFPSQYSGQCIDSSQGTDVMDGTSSQGLSGSAYSYTVSDTTSQAINISGENSDGPVITGIDFGWVSSDTLWYKVSGPPDTTYWIENYSSSSEGGVGGGDWTETVSAGTGYSAASGVADELGSSPPDSAMHLGTTPGQLDTSQGLVSALGGAGAHALTFAGPEVKPVDNGDAVVLEEGWGGGESPSNWVAHPSASGIGYRRPSPGVASSGSQAAIPPSTGDQPVMDSGTSDGSDSDELSRVTNFDSGSNENGGVTQSMPTSRAQGVAGAFGLAAGFEPGHPEPAVRRRRRG